jgi:hypothetical protein
MQDVVEIIAIKMAAIKVVVEILGIIVVVDFWRDKS